MIEVSTFGKKWSFLTEKEVFLACSGGVDSMVLCHLIREINPKITLLHVNYHLRGKESDEDENFVKAYAQKNKLAFEVLSAELTPKNNLQANAREIRYTWFADKTRDENAVLLVAHNQDDQLETFYLNLARKSGNAGMACMPENHGKLMRPLLDYSKKEIYAFARKQQLPWREDSSNTKNDYTRNRLRNEILPFLETEIPGLRNSVLSLINVFRENREMEEELAGKWRDKILKSGVLALSVWRGLTVEQRIYILKSFGYAPRQLSEVEKLEKAQKGKSCSSPEYKIIREKDHFSFQPVQINRTKATLEVEMVEALPEIFSKNEIYLDAGKISGELRLRTWKKGDRIASLGIKGSQLISDIITDAKIPNAQRDTILIVEDGQEIHWCVGLKIGGNALADEHTETILRVLIKNT